MIIIDAAFCVLAILTALFDIKKRIIPNALIIAGFCGFIVTFALLEPESLIRRLLYSGIIFLALFLFRKLVKNRFGMGDIKFLALAAFVQGLFGTWAILLIACGFAIIIVFLYNAIYKKKASERVPIPFAPYLALGTLVFSILKYVLPCYHSLL